MRILLCQNAANSAGLGVANTSRNAGVQTGLGGGAANKNASRITTKGPAQGGIGGGATKVATSGAPKGPLVTLAGLSTTEEAFVDRTAAAAAPADNSSRVTTVAATEIGQSSQYSAVLAAVGRNSEVGQVGPSLGLSTEAVDRTLAAYAPTNPDGTPKANGEVG
jgi:hypothetical protein